MCGIAFCLTDNRIKGQRFCTEAISTLAHRGPDGSGLWNDNVCWMMHRRLAIQDLSEAGKQPMVSPSGRYVISFNGEIYNHLELRKKYLGHFNFNGHSDTETLLALYELMGANMQQHLVGMWAFVIWDVQEQQAFISRDRFGQKPLYWVRDQTSWYFSSEIKPLLSIIQRVEVNSIAISEYIALGNYDHLGEEIFHKGVYTFPSSHYAVVTRQHDRIHSIPYWKLREVPFKERVPFEKKQAMELRELVVEAVHSQLLSDVPVGATLSGGLDSSIIASCIAILGKKKFPVFTAQFPGTPFDESKYVQALKDKYEDSFELIKAPVGELNLRADLDRSLQQQEEPFGDPSIMAHGYLVKAAQSNKVPVLLGGQGGDEISMGYPWMYHRLVSYALHHHSPGLLREFMRYENSAGSLKARIILSGIFPALEKKIRLLARAKQKHFLQAAYQIDSPASRFGSSAEFNGIYKESLYSVGLPHLCHYDDRSTMALSIEGRMPFLDHRIFEFVSQLREDAFYRNGFSKFLLREAFRDVLPDLILNRKDKIGFFTPLKALIKNDASYIANQLNKSLFLKSVVDQSFLADMITRLRVGETDTVDSRVVFRMLSVGVWEKQLTSSK
jgi:asparagine synthase (glutamine-hydrolysing)